MATADDIASPLDALLVEAALGPVRRFAPDLSGARLLASLATRPRLTARRVGSLTADLAQIALGTSTITPSRRDRRFADEAWSTNPVLRRVVQTYLAAGRTAERLVADADLEWRDDQRARFLVENVLEALAPSNVPLVNPASAKAVVDTGGLNVARGLSAFVKDMASAPRIPEMVDGTPFEVGRTVAATPGAVVLRTEVFELIRYAPRTPASAPAASSPRSPPPTWPPRVDRTGSPRSRCWSPCSTTTRRASPRRSWVRGWPSSPSACPGGGDTSTAAPSPRSSPGSDPATSCGTTGSTTTCSARSRRRSTSCSGTPTPPGCRQRCTPTSSTSRWRTG